MAGGSQAAGHLRQHKGLAIEILALKLRRMGGCQISTVK